MLDDRLTFASDHVHHTTSKGRSKCYALTKLKRYGVNKAGLVRIYKSCILPVLTYAAPSWFPFVSKHSCQQLETVQKLSLKIIYPELDTYEERLSNSGLKTLQEVLDESCKTYCDKNLGKHKNILPSESTECRRSARLNTTSRPTIKHRTATASKCLFIKYNKSGKYIL